MVNLFIDCEFTCLDMLKMKPISIAFVDESGYKQFYAEFADTYRTSDCHPFVVKNVLPRLLRSKYEMNINIARNRLYDYFDSFHDMVKIWSDAIGWDQAILWDIFPSFSDDIWPPNVDKQFGTLMYYGDDALTWHATQRELFNNKQSDLRDRYVGRQMYEHNALDDALANWICWRLLNKEFYDEKGNKL